MFDNYFVTCNVAIALKKAGFDELCMAVHEHYEFEGKQYQNFMVCYNSQVPDPEAHLQEIRALIKERPGFQLINANRLQNSQLQPWLYAAPLYQQVFEWLLRRNIRAHDVFINSLAETGLTVGWSCTLFSVATGKALCPPITVAYKHEHSLVPYHDQLIKDQIKAWEAIILEALKILKESK